MRGVFAGGHSAGHLSPSIAIAEQFLRLAPEPEALFFGAQRDLDRKLLAPYRHHLLPAAGMPYGLSPRTLVSLAKMAWAGMQALGVLRGYRADVFVGTGGYVVAASAPAANALHVPLVLHASDARPDRTNQKLAGLAHTITVAFEAAAEYFPADKVVVTGQPVREEALVGDRASARAELGYGPDDFVFFITGGSQGAQTLNTAVLGAAPALLANGVKILHQTGSFDFERVSQQSVEQQFGPNYTCLAFHPELARLLAAADLILMRAGASSLAEAAAWGVPMLLVPLALAQGHQRYNALELVRREAALMIENADLTPGVLIEHVRALMGQPERLQAMSAAASGWHRRGAAEQIARLMIQAGGGGG